MPFIANARMYSVTPAAEAAWRDLLARIGRDAGVDLVYESYPAPAPLEDLWRRTDLGAVFMCGYPIALGIADVVPLAAPIPAAQWAEGRAVYRSDLIVKRDAPFQTLADTFGGTCGWTVEHSHSGFNAFRHHLLRYRTPERPSLYTRSVGGLVTARRIVDEVANGTIDIGPLDAYWHMLLARYAPDIAANVRVLEPTATVPMPAFVAAPGLPADHADRLRSAFSAASGEPWFAAYRDALLIDGFEAVTHAFYDVTMAWDRDAKAAGYEVPG